MFLLALGATLSCLGQTKTDPSPGLPKDPREVFAMAAPFYDFTSPTLKPWHLKATYQLYDENGKPGEQGTYEYWWVSPQAYRSTWTRVGAKHTDWRTPDGRYVSQSTGEPLTYFEYQLQSALLLPLPPVGDLDPAKSRLVDESVTAGGAKVPCFMVVPLSPLVSPKQDLERGTFPTYCFDSQRPILLGIYSFGSVLTQFSNIVQPQGKYLAREVGFREGKRNLLTAKVETIDGIGPADPALTPSPDAVGCKLCKVNLSGALAGGMLIKKFFPKYPEDAKAAHVQGTVVLQGIIGPDGKIHDLRVVSAPRASLAAASFWAVMQWEYRPYRLNGDPVAVETTMNVTFTLGP